MYIISDLLHLILNIGLYTTINRITLHVVVMNNLTFFVRFGKPQDGRRRPEARVVIEPRGGGGRNVGEGRAGLGKERGGNHG